MHQRAQRTKTARLRPFFVVGGAIVLVAAIGTMLLPARSAIAISCGTSDPSVTDASSATHTPSEKASSARPATSR